MTGTLLEGEYTCMVISWLILIRIGNVSDKTYRENQNTH